MRFLREINIRDGKCNNIYGDKYKTQVGSKKTSRENDVKTQEIIFS